MSKVESCWTCRLRRKKCGREQPACQACSSLSIACHYGKARPDWMDGGKKQDQKTQSIKTEIKQAAEARRKRQYVRVLSIRNDTAPRETVALTKAYDEEQTESAGAAQRQTKAVCPDCVAAEASESKTNKELAAAWLQLGSGSPNGLLEDCEVDFTTMYLDHVFPFLFPFYRHGLLDGGRAWLLAVLQSNKTIFHATMSLSSYFLALIVSDTDICRHEVCKRQAWDKLGEHTDAAFQSIQKEMRGLNDLGAHATLLQRARVMESIAHLLVFEIAMTRTHGLDMHLNAAMAVFEELFEHCKVDDEPSIELLMKALHKPSFAALIFDRRVWNPDQAALRFFLATLLWADVISSTSLNRAARLHNYHAYLIFDESSGSSVEHKDLLRIEHYVACPGWVLRAINEATTLGLWKREAKSKGTFVLEELVIRGDRICETVRDGLKRLKTTTANSASSTPHDIFYRNYRPSDARRFEEHDAAALIWAYAASIYVTVVVIGWQPRHRLICDNVVLILHELQTILSPAALRSLVWPFCVAGCLASPEQEQCFRALAAACGTLQGFGTVGQALRIMECVWQQRDQLDGDWDLSSCFGILGSPALLL